MAMSLEREKMIAEYRQRQPIAELLRKENKALGRWSNSYWLQESIDRAKHEAKIILAQIMSNLR